LRPLTFRGTPENGTDVTQNGKIRQCASENLHAVSSAGRIRGDAEKIAAKKL
jgi:hypothetical protein